MAEEESDDELTLAEQETHEGECYDLLVLLTIVTCIIDTSCL